ncbi:HD domain-containing protein [Oceaniglobus ichthyenteri]|uniref:HD domain-containing protein n=1 Tax=Oceaniglobus ichthyenteri TaxID=2136177 RepID=UPI000D361387|nr:HD domain-containing protein [Oceaniglobus ichthyenteri]
MLPIPDLIAACENEVRRIWGDADDGAHDLAHLYRVWNLCQVILQGEGGTQTDLQILAPAAVLHDIVNLPKNSPDRARAAHLSADHAVRFLGTLPYPDSLVSQVAHAIRAHSFSASITPRTRTAKILQDADRLEALGALGIARNMIVAGQIGAQICHPTDPLGEHRPLDDTAYALDHWPLKLFPIAENLHTETARTLAAPRLAMMRAFRDQLLAELAPR